MKLPTGTNQPAPATGTQVGASASRRWRLGSWHLWLGIAFSLGFLWLSLRGVDLGELVGALVRVNVLLLGLAVASYVLTTAAKAARWQLLLSAHKAPSFARSFSALSVGVLVNSFLPARLGEFARAYLLGTAEGASKVYVLGSIALEKGIDLLFLLLALTILLIQMALPVWLADSARGVALLIVVLAPCLALLIWQRNFILRRLERASRFVPPARRAWLLRQTCFGLASLDVLRRPRLLAGLFGWSLFVWILSVLTNYLVFLMLGLVLPFWTALLLLVVLQVGSAVPSSPGRIGVFQYLVITTLSIFAVDRSIALEAGILLYLVIYAPVVLIGTLCLWREKVTWQKFDKVLTLMNRPGL